MIGKILKSTFANFQTFLVIWGVVLIVNQLFIFHGCMQIYCLLAALPHTGFIAALIAYFISDEQTQVNHSGNEHPMQKSTSQSQPASVQQFENVYERLENVELDVEDFEETKEPFCPKCGSKMVLRTAKKGSFAGQQFWGCSKFPVCNGTLKL